MILNMLLSVDSNVYTNKINSNIIFISPKISS